MKFKHIIWLPFNVSEQYINMAKNKGLATNQLQAKILIKALEDICTDCQMPKLICECKVLTCQWCKKEYKQGFDERFCSQDCAKAWWNTY